MGASREPAVGGGGDTQPQTDVVARAAKFARAFDVLGNRGRTEVKAVISELIAEVEKLRQMVGHCTGCGEICDGRCGQW